MSVNSSNHTSQSSQKHQYPDPVLNFGLWSHNTATNVNHTRAPVASSALKWHKPPGFRASKQSDPTRPLIDPIIALNFGQGFVLPNLVVIDHSWIIWPLVDPGRPLLRSQQWTTLNFGQRFSLSNLVAIGHSWAIWRLVDPCMTFDPVNTLHFCHGFLLPHLVAIVALAISNEQFS